MKKLITALCLCTSLVCHAQGIGDWFNQKKTKIKLLGQQIAALQVYIGYVQQGYKIASQGLHAITDIKNGEFSLHSVYFNSLKSVNPKIKHAAEVAEIIALQVAIVNHFKQAIKEYKAGNEFSVAELNYITNVYTSLADDLAKDIDALITVISDNKLQMTDDERINAINKLYANTQDKSAFAQHFTNGGFILAQQRQNEQRDSKVVKDLYDSK